MFIETIEPLHFGPFSNGEILRLERDVTVLTGPNDVGKSSILRLLARVFGGTASQTGFEELHFEPERTSSVNWETREDFGAVIHLGVDEQDEFKRLLPPEHIAKGLRVRGNIAPGKRSSVIEAVITKENVLLKQDWRTPTHSVRVVSLPPSNEIRNIVEFKSPSEVEVNLFRLGLGGKRPIGRLANLQTGEMSAELGRAEKRLNREMQKIVPQSLGIQWSLRPSINPPGIHCSLADGYGGLTPLGSRGTGLRKLMGVLAELMHHDFSEGHWLILFDEPECSLHADSQHLLRRLLESLAEKPNVQVIYATHSPSMINRLRPQSVRLLTREMVDEKPRTRINNAPFRDSFRLVRSSLGMSPADSLLYAPITIIVEGDTEAIGLPLLLLKLEAANVPGFQGASVLLSQCHFLDGMGDRLSFVCTMAKSQGAKPILFVDGDKKRHLAQHKLRARRE